MTLICSSENRRLFDEPDRTIQSFGPTSEASAKLTKWSIVCDKVSSSAKLIKHANQLNGLRLVRLDVDGIKKIETILNDWRKDIDDWRERRAPWTKWSESLITLDFIISSILFGDRKNTTLFFIAKDCQNIIQGIMQLNTENESVLEIDFLAVNPTRFIDREQSLKGAGTMLIIKAAQYAILKGRTEIHLSASSTSESYYKKIGFRKTRECLVLDREKFLKLPAYLALNASCK